MRKLILLFLVATTLSASAQTGFRAPEQEHFVLNVFLDYAPTHNTEKSKYGLDYVIEAGYSGLVEAKVGIESFSKLTGGYFDIHGAIGFKMVSGRYEQYNYYAGLRLARVFRTGPKGKAYRYQNGFEAQFTVDITEDVYLGVRYTYDQRYDQEILGWEPTTQSSGFLVIGFKIKRL